ATALAVLSGENARGARDPVSPGSHDAANVFRRRQPDYRRALAFSGVLKERAWPIQGSAAKNPHNGESIAHAARETSLSAANSSPRSSSWVLSPFWGRSPAFCWRAP